MLSHSAIIEAILFYKAEPMKISRLATILALSEEDIKKGLEELKNSLENRGLTIIQKDDDVTLGTKPETAKIIEKMKKEELSQDLGKAALETLAIVIYRKEVSRAEIDYIRGVNSSFILRNLMIRGLLERVSNPDDSRGYLYRPTFDLLAHLGLSKTSEMPEFEEVQSEIKNFLTNNEEDKNEA